MELCSVSAGASATTRVPASSSVKPESTPRASSCSVWAAAHSDMEMWRALGSPERVDDGASAGRGLFARDVLDWSQKQFPEFSRALRYGLVEQSAHLRERLQDQFIDTFGGADPRIFLECIDSAAFAGGEHPYLATNFFDALPVEVVDHRGAVRVGFENGRLVESFVAPSAAENEFLDRYGIHPEAGERVEAPLASLSGWSTWSPKSFVTSGGSPSMIDYGYTREEQLAGRHRDTIMTYRRHTASTSPYAAPASRTSPRM